jgi:hypothetical protein
MTFRQPHYDIRTTGEGSMSKKFCTVCGAVLSDASKFCEQCGSPIDPGLPAMAPQPAVPVGPPSGNPPVLSSSEGRKGIKHPIFVAAVVLLLGIIVGVIFFVLPGLSGTEAIPVSVPGSAVTTVLPVTSAAVPPASIITIAPTPEPGPFPDALRLKERFPFGTGKVGSEATVYKYWINDTYQWHNDMDNHYYVQKPKAGNRYLFVFVHLQNNGDTRVWFPPAGNVVVYYNGATYYQDRNHFKPDKAQDAKEKPVEVNEVQYFQKLNGEEYVEDFGFSHGTELAYLYPGRSNAVDGYIIYEVPQSLIPEETYVGIPFNSQDSGVWKLE